MPESRDVASIDEWLSALEIRELYYERFSVTRTDVEGDEPRERGANVELDIGVANHVD